MAWSPEPLPPQPQRSRARFDGHRYRDCRWCHGRGCLQCEHQADADYRRAFPAGPVKIATIRVEEIGQLKDVLGPEAIGRYYGPNGLGDRAFERDLNAKLAEIRAEAFVPGTATGWPALERGA